MDISTLVQGVLAWFYLIMTFEVLYSSTKNIIGKQYPFEGRMLFLIYSHMVYFDSIKIANLKFLTSLPFLNFFLNEPIITAYNWINSFTSSFLGLSFKGNPTFMFTYLLPLFFVYNFTEYWFQYGFSDKRLSKLISFAAVMLFVSSNGALGFIASMVKPYGALTAGLLAGGGVFAIFTLLISTIGLIPFFNFGALNTSLESLISATTPSLGSPQSGSGIFSSIVGLFDSLGLPSQTSYLIIFGVIFVLLFVLIYTFYRMLMSMLAEKIFGSGLKTLLFSGGLYFSLASVVFGISFTLLASAINSLGGALDLSAASLASIPLSIAGFVLGFIILAFLAELLVFAAMLVLFNNLKFVFTNRGGGSSNAVAQASGVTDTDGLE